MSGLTRKHFAAVAHALAESINRADQFGNMIGAEYVRNDTVQRVANALKQFNPAFDQARFVQACNATPRER